MPVSDPESLRADFDAAVARSRSLPAQPPAVLLELYGLFKQASAGDATGKRPGMLDVRGRAKFDAWAARKGMAQADAQRAYIANVDALAAG